MSIEQEKICAKLLTVPTVIIPARIRAPKDKPSVEGAVKLVSTQIIAALSNERFFSLAELNEAIWKKLDEFNRQPFQKRRVAGLKSSATKNCHY